jgi:Ca2+-binding RTX toxin-like protein
LNFSKRVASTNALGTTVTVGDLGTAFQVAGGSGHDTLVAQGFTLTAAQRTEVFATSSIEIIVDQTGTYGSNFNNTLIGNSGDNDTLIGGAGADHFVFDDAALL